MTPRWVDGEPGSDAYLPTLFGVSHVLRVRSGLICFQVCPASTVFHRWLFAKNSERLSTSENTTGMVRSRRQLPTAPPPPTRPPPGPTAGENPPPPRPPRRVPPPARPAIPGRFADRIGSRCGHHRRCRD